MYFIEESTEEKESSLFIYNINSESNGTFYCVAENSAGVTSANYTIMIILKREPIRLEEEPEFPIDIIPILLAIGIVLMSLCFVAIIMALVKNHTKSKRRKQNFRNKGNTLPIPVEKSTVQKKSILKSTDNHENVFISGCDEIEIGDQQISQIPERNPDIINGISSDQNSASGIQLYKNSSPRNNPEVFEPNEFLSGSTLTIPNKAKVSKNYFISS